MGKGGWMVWDGEKRKATGARECKLNKTEGGIGGKGKISQRNKMHCPISHTFRLDGCVAENRGRTSWVYLSRVEQP